NGGVAINHDVPSQQADLVVAPDPAEVSILLVRERLDWRGVDGPRVVFAGHEDAELAYHGLARACWRGDQDRVSVGERADRLQLEIIELVGQAGRKLVDELFGRHTFVQECTVSCPLDRRSGCLWPPGGRQVLIMGRYTSSGPSKA